MSHWVVLCEAAGFDMTNMDEMDSYRLAGKIIGDPILSARAHAAPRDPNATGIDSYPAVLESNARAKALAAMTENERCALRERISGPDIVRNTPEAKLFMQENWPMMLELLNRKDVQDQFFDAGKCIDWNGVNALERECGLPQSDCPPAFLPYRGKPSDGK
jgi:hypothetical protein